LDIGSLEFRQRKRDRERCTKTQTDMHTDRKRDMVRPERERQESIWLVHFQSSVSAQCKQFSSMCNRANFPKKTGANILLSFPFSFSFFLSPFFPLYIHSSLNLYAWDEGILESCLLDELATSERG
jgi:hypothetical protein